MSSINIYEAKTRLPQRVDEAASGKDVLISRYGKPIARLTALTLKASQVKFGVLKGRVRIAPGPSRSNC